MSGARQPAHRARARVAIAFARALPLLAAWPAEVAAHPGRPPEPHDLWAAWTLEPQVVLPLLAWAALYGRGVHALWTRAGRAAGVRRWEVACFAAGWVALALALTSPLHALGAALFSAHMAQHEVLMALAAPLLVLGRPAVAALWALPRHTRMQVGRRVLGRPLRGAWRAVSGAGAATVIHGAAVWAWHAPPLYQATLRSDLAHAAQHACFVGTALLFWWAVLSPRARRTGVGTAIAALFVTLMHTGALGALLTLGERTWYPWYERTAPAWGLTALEDQQLAGLVMWVPGSVAYIAAALALLGAVLGPRRPAPRARLPAVLERREARGEG